MFDYLFSTFDHDSQQKEIEALRKALGTLITWMAQSANSPISMEEAGKLLAIIESKRNP